MPDVQKTWFEAELPWPLASLLNRVSTAWQHSGKVRREEIEAQIDLILRRREPNEQAL